MTKPIKRRTEDVLGTFKLPHGQLKIHGPQKARIEPWGYEGEHIALMVPSRYESDQRHPIISMEHRSNGDLWFLAVDQKTGAQKQHVWRAGDWKVRFQ
jgi:hypothetical protein